MITDAPQLDPDAQAILEVIEASGRPTISSFTVSALREQMRATFISPRPPLPLLSVEEGTVPSAHSSLRVRIYRNAPDRRPALLFLHGGGWMTNDLDTHDDICRRIAAASGCTVVALDFRRAPEHKHPAPVEDAYVTFRWLIDNASDLNIDPERVAIMGESSGGMTAASLSLLLRDSGAPPPAFQILAYPAVDCKPTWPSYSKYGTGYILDLETMQWYLENYVAADADRDDPYLFPLLADDFTGLPPSLIITAEFDPLRDEGIAYADKLSAAGVPVERMHVNDQMHGFLLLGSAISKVPAIIDQIAGHLARATA